MRKMTFGQGQNREPFESPVYRERRREEFGRSEASFFSVYLAKVDRKLADLKADKSKFDSFYYNVPNSGELRKPTEDLFKSLKGNLEKIRETILFATKEENKKNNEIIHLQDVVEVFYKETQHA